MVAELSQGSGCHRRVGRERDEAKNRLQRTSELDMGDLGCRLTEPTESKEIEEIISREMKREGVSRRSQCLPG